MHLYDFMEILNTFYTLEKWFHNSQPIKDEKALLPTPLINETTSGVN